MSSYPIKLICAWHKPEMIVIREGTEPASHGMCTECFKAAMAELKRRKR